MKSKTLSCVCSHFYHIFIHNSWGESIIFTVGSWWKGKTFLKWFRHPEWSTNSIIPNKHYTQFSSFHSSGPPIQCMKTTTKLPVCNGYHAKLFTRDVYQVKKTNWKSPTRSIAGSQFWGHGSWTICGLLWWIAKSTYTFSNNILLLHFSNALSALSLVSIDDRFLFGSIWIFRIVSLEVVWATRLYSNNYM